MIRTTILPILRRRTIRLRNHYHGISSFNNNITAIIRSKRIRNRRPWEATTRRCFSSSSATDEPPPSLSTSTKTNNNKRIEDRYSRKTPLEHILLRPGMYVGSVERQSSHSHWMWNDDTKTMMPPNSIEKEKGIVPALIKVLDEIIVNASDNHFRHPTECTQMDVTIATEDDGKSLYCSVTNNGPGIPVEWHSTEQLYVPELVFGHLLTGSNFDDASSSGETTTTTTTTAATTGGRHGYGAKLTNIFSHEFVLDTVCDGTRYQQTWRNNMHEMEPAIVTASPEDDYTRVSFRPDLQKLTGRSETTNADVAVMKRRVLDIAACLAKTNCRVTLNGELVTPGSFQEYCQLYVPADTNLISTTMNGGKWEVVVGVCPSIRGISFVNGIHTVNGGTHVQWMTQQIAKAIIAEVAKEHPDLTVHPKHVRSLLFLGLNVNIEDPSFDSQAKETLTTSSSTSDNNWPSLPESFEKLLLGDGPSGLFEAVVTAAQKRQEAQTLLTFSIEKTKTKQRRQLQGLTKLEDAHSAGRKRYHKDDPGCTLILTEGDSAKALAVAGLEVIGRQHFGVFPLKGKLMNVKKKHTTMKRLAENDEIKALTLILGLDFNKSYATQEERDSLRYQHVLLMTDQDNDGTHIKGLMINFFHHYWPNLLSLIDDDDDEVKDNKKVYNKDKDDDDEEEEEEEEKPWPRENDVRMPPNFLSCFVTPLLKATPKNNKTNNKEVLSFYNMADYQAWAAQEPSPENYTLKYYKGLGTSTPAEAREYFRQFKKHIVPFHYQDYDRDGVLLNMVFEQGREADRREWILANAGTKYDDEIPTFNDDDDEREEEETDESDSNHSNSSMSYQDFINNEFIHYSNADILRSIPSVIDGLKPTQRKVFYACRKRSQSSEIKVAQLSGYCAEQTAYHHGEKSMHMTIVNMAQDFCGSNNLNLLIPSGQFGTRLQGGTDAASARYIFTKLAPVTKLLFPVEDDVLLDYIQEEGQSIEPYYYCPIIPFLLVNGAQGIGTGWSTYIPPHNPLDLVECIYSKLQGHNESDDTTKIMPWVRGFTGTTEPKESGGFLTHGKIRRASMTSLEITELPVNKWTNDYKRVLLRMQDTGDIKSFVENHTTTSVHFVIRCTSTQIEQYTRRKGGLESKFRLTSSLNTTNMHAFEPVQINDNDESKWTMKITKYDSAEDIINAYFPIRHALYQDRHSVVQSELAYNSAVASNKARFIQDVMDKKIDLLRMGQKREELENRLMEHEFDDQSTLQAIRQDNALANRRKRTTNSPTIKDDDDEEEKTNKTGNFDYLLNMPLSSVAEENIGDLHRAAEKNQQELEDLQETTPEDLWMNDLDKLAASLKKN